MPDIWKLVGHLKAAGLGVVRSRPGAHSWAVVSPVGHKDINTQNTALDVITHSCVVSKSRPT